MPERTVNADELSELSRLLCAEVMEKLRAEINSASPERTEAWAHVIDACACFVEDSE
jgi:hypothetical protein